VDTRQDKVRLNKPAAIGLLLSVTSIFGIGLFGLIGLVLGIVALVQIGHTHERGKGLAVAAVIIGFIWSVVIGLVRRLIATG
jgi:Na+/H+ antiporter NhaB